MKRKHPIRHEVRAYKHKDGTGVSAYIRGQGSKTQSHIANPTPVAKEDINTNTQTRLAILFAEQSYENYKKRYSNKEWSRNTVTGELIRPIALKDAIILNAIVAAKECLKNPSKENAETAKKAGIAAWSEGRNQISHDEKAAFIAYAVSWAARSAESFAKGNIREAHRYARSVTKDIQKSKDYDY